MKKQPIYAIVKYSINSTGYSHLYIGFHLADTAEELKSAINTNDLPYSVFGEVYQYLTFDTQYGSGGSFPVDDPKPYGFGLSVNITGNVSIQQLDATTKLAKKIDRDMNKKLREGDDWSYINQVKVLFDVVGIDALVTVGSDHGLIWSQKKEAVNAVNDINHHIIDQYQKVVS